MTRNMQIGTLSAFLAVLVTTVLGSAWRGKLSEDEHATRLAAQVTTEHVMDGVITKIADAPAPYGIKGYVCKLDRQPDEKFAFAATIRIWGPPDLRVGDRVRVDSYSFLNSAGSLGSTLWASPTDEQKKDE